MNESRWNMDRGDVETNCAKSMKVGFKYINSDFALLKSRVTLRVRSKLKKHFRNLVFCSSSRVSHQKSLCLQSAKQRGNNASMAESFI